MQYWSAIVYNAEIAVKFSELPCIQNYPDLPYTSAATTVPIRDSKHTCIASCRNQNCITNECFLLCKRAARGAWHVHETNQVQISGQDLGPVDLWLTRPACCLATQGDFRIWTRFLRKYVYFRFINAGVNPYCTLAQCMIER